MRSARRPRLLSQAGGVALLLLGYLGTGILLQSPPTPAPAPPPALVPPGAPPFDPAGRPLLLPPPAPFPPGPRGAIPPGDDPVPQSQPIVTPFTQPQGRTLGQLHIPRIALKVAYVAGVSDVPLRRGPGHWSQTPMPTAAGNAVLSGHRTTYTRPFSGLDRLRRGDKVMINTGRRRGVTYRVTETLIVPEAQYAGVVLPQPRNAAARVLTMFACHPEGLRTHRIVVRARAEPISTRGGANPARKGAPISHT